MHIFKINQCELILDNSMFYRVFPPSFFFFFRYHSKVETLVWIRDVHVYIRLDSMDKMYFCTGSVLKLLRTNRKHMWGRRKHSQKILNIVKYAKRTSSKEIKNTPRCSKTRWEYFTLYFTAYDLWITLM